MPYSRRLLGENRGSAVVRISALCFAAICAIFHIGSAIYWMRVPDHLLSALVSALLAAASSLVVGYCLTAQWPGASSAVSAVLTLTTMVLVLLYGV